MYDPYNDPHSPHYIDPKHPCANLLRRTVAATSASWNEFLARVTHPERYAHELEPDEPKQSPPPTPGSPREVISSPAAQRATGAVARLVALLRAPGERRLTVADIKSRCGIHKANLSRTLRTSTIATVMEAEGWRREGGRFCFALVRGTRMQTEGEPKVTGEHAWDF